MYCNEYSDLTICVAKITAKSSFYERVKTAALFELSKLVNGVSNANKRLSGTEIWDATQKNFSNLFDSQGDSFYPDQQRDTFIQYLSKHVRDPESPLNSEGQRKGFYIDYGKIHVMNAIDTLIFDTTISSQLIYNESVRGRIARESTLYSVIQTWLVTMGFQAGDISNGKLGGKWGNPDLAGIKTSEGFQGISLEILTIEVKASSKDWERQIFEAVSHLRFANRAYFAYAEAKSRQFVQLTDIKHYAERFGVGVLKLVLEDEDYDNLLNGSDLKQYSSTDVEIQEVCPAPFGYVQHSHQTKFCQNLGINSLKDAHSWGKTDN